jgi:hypothetical protein
MRGKYAVLPASAREDEMARFARRAGRGDVRARDPGAKMQALYVSYIFYQRTELDGIVISAKELARRIFETGDAN